MDLKEFEELESVVRQQIARVSWSHKIQCKQSDICDLNYKFLRVVNIIAASLTSAGLISLIIVDNQGIKIVSAIISFITILTNSLLKVIDLQNMKKEHSNAANNLWNIREKLILLLIKTGVANEEFDHLLSEYEEINSALASIYKQAPSTTKRAVKEARKAINKEKDDTFSDDDINIFLPQRLRI